MGLTRPRFAALGFAAALAVGGLAVAPSPVAAAPALDLPTPASGHGITVVDWSPVDDLDPGRGQVWEVDLTTPAIFRSGPSGAPPSIDPTSIRISVRILFPADYTTDPRPNDVLYLLHGGTGGVADYSTNREFRLKETVAESPFDGIVVMPEGGRTGWYTDWYGETDGHFSPHWETFHVSQLVPWIDANFNTTASRSGRAVMGLSMGGLGALMYGARHSDVFGAIGSMSGGTDLGDRDAQQIVDNSMWGVGATVGWTGALNGKFRVNNWGTGSPLDQRTYRLQTVFGPPVTRTDPAGNVILDERGTDPKLFWPDHNPIEMVDRYAAYDGRLAVYSGQEGEAENGRWNNRFHNALLAGGVEHRFCSGYGTHDWPYWQNDFEDFLRFVSGATPSTCTTNAGWTEKPGPTSPV